MEIAIEKFPPSINDFIEDVIEKPEVEQNLIECGIATFFNKDDKLAEDITKIVKVLFDHGKNIELETLGPLPELYTNGFESEQIWEEIQLQSIPLFEYADKNITEILLADDSSNLFLKDEGGEYYDEEEEEEEEDDDFNGNKELNEDEQENEEDEEEDETDGGDDQIEEEEEDMTEDNLENYEEEEDYDTKKGKKVSFSNKNTTKIIPKRKINKTIERDADDARIEDDFFNYEDLEEFQKADMAYTNRETEAIHENLFNKSSLKSKGNDVNFDDFFGAGSNNKSKAKDDELDDDEEMDEEKMEDEDEDEENDVEDDRLFYDDGLDEDETNDNDMEGVDDYEEEMGEEEEEEEEKEANNSSKSKKRALESETDSEVQSSHQKRMMKLAATISSLENELAGDKPWLLTGEVTSFKRPTNSLLSAEMDFEASSRVAPAVTTETTMALEDLIKQRILDEAFDDPVRKVDEVPKPKKTLVEVSQEKSRSGLGDLYGEDYQREVMGVKDKDKNAPKREEIGSLFKHLCSKLDALSNFHFTPKPVAHELVIQSSVPAIQMEEIIPLSVSNATLTAPEEVFEKKKGREGVLRNKEELSSDQKNALRLSKKTSKRKHLKQKKHEEKIIEKINPGLGNKYSKEKIKSVLADRKVQDGKKLDHASSFSSSGNFFKKLSNEVSKEVQGFKEQNKSKSKKSNNASNFKL